MLPQPWAIRSPARPNGLAGSDWSIAIVFGDGWKLSSRANIFHHGKESNRLNAVVGNIAPAYTLLNARIELESPHGWSLYAMGRNITDEVYFPELNGASRMVGAPATYAVGARFSF